MVEESTQEWFLEVEGRKTGPFATDQILGLFVDQEIPGAARILSSAPGSEWTTVAALAAKEQPAPARRFVPPPRPAELQSATSVPVAQILSPSSKPELSLMDALRVTKERRSRLVKASKPADLISRVQAIPRKAWLMTATALFLLAATWSMTLFIKQKAPSVATQTPPVKPVNHDMRSVTPAPVAPAKISAALPSTQTIQPAPHSTAMSPPPTLRADTDRLREQEREDQLRDQERERDVASTNDAAPQNGAVAEIEPSALNPVPPASPPHPEQGLEVLNPSAAPSPIE